ncbi:MAG: MotA/TolQ/ExbB proton channel family protein [Proteocatella sp.]
MDFISIFQKGGYVMYPIILASVLAGMIAMERSIFYKKAKTNIEKLVEELPGKLLRKDFSAAEKLCQETGGLAAIVLIDALQKLNYPGSQQDIIMGAANRMARDLKKYLGCLSVIVTMAPLLGLLGTVTGMIQSFSVLSVSSGQPFAITGGVGEALIATATGLLVAIFVLVLHTYLMHRANSLIAELEYVSTIYLTAIGGRGNDD